MVGANSVLTCPLPFAFRTVCAFLCRPLPDFPRLLSEIAEHVTYVTPWSAGTARVPSSAFCCLFKLCLLRPTAEQVAALLEYPDAPQVRALGFLFLRYACPPKDLWTWLAPWMKDSELFAPTPDRSDRVTVGEYVLSLVTQPQYHGSLLPRIPLTTKRNMMLKVRLCVLPCLSTAHVCFGLRR